MCCFIDESKGVTNFEFSGRSANCTRLVARTNPRIGKHDRPGYSAQYSFFLHFHAPTLFSPRLTMQMTMTNKNEEIKQLNSNMSKSIHRQSHQSRLLAPPASVSCPLLRNIYKCPPFLGFSDKIMSVYLICVKQKYTEIQFERMNIQSFFTKIMRSNLLYEIYRNFQYLP